MATVNSNLLTPQQAALNKKKDTNPLLKLAGKVASTVFPVASVPIAAGMSAYNAAKPQSTAVNMNLAKPTMVNNLGTPAKSTFTPATAPVAQKPVAQQQNTASYTPPAAPTAPQAPVVDKQTSLPQSLLGTILTELIQRGKQSQTASQDVSEAARRSYEAAARAREITDQYGQEYAAVGKQGAKARAGYLTTGTTPVAQGRAAVVAQTTAAQQQAIAEGAQAALSGVDKELLAANQAATAFGKAGDMAQSALSTGSGIAAPIQQPYSNMLVDPVTGQPIQQSNAGGGSMADAVSLQIQRLANNAGSYDQAVQALSAYGQAGVNALNQALGPNFDPAQSNANAAAKTAALQQNVTQGRSVELAANSAYAAMDKLTTDFAALDPIFKSGIPKTNDIASTIANYLGQGAVSQYQSTLNDARAQVSAVLQATGGATPTDAMNTARGYLPDGMTPAQLPEKLAAARELVRQKVEAYTKTGSVPQYNPQTGVNQPSAPVKGWTWAR